jgi:flavin-binding protein dodecin
MTSVARVTEISAMSEVSFEDAIRVGLDRASETLRGIQSAWIKEQEVTVGARGFVTGYKVNMLVTFVLDSASEPTEYLDPATQTADLATLDEGQSP